MPLNTERLCHVRCLITGARYHYCLATGAVFDRRLRPIVKGRAFDFVRNCFAESAVRMPS